MNSPLPCPPAEDSAAHLADEQRSLALFAEGIAGRYHHIRSVEDLPDGQGGLAHQNASHDAGALYLPESIDWFQSRDLNAAAYRLTALYQLGFREFGTYRFDIGMARDRIAALGLREPPAAHRESDIAIFFAHFEVPELARRLFHVIEMARVRAAVVRRYPGADRYRRALLDVRLDAEQAYSDGIAGEVERLEAALEGLPVASAFALHAGAVADEDADVYDSAAAVTACMDSLEFYPEGSDESAPNEGPQLEWLQRQTRLEDWDEDLADLDAKLLSLAVAEALEEGEAVAGEADRPGDLRDTDADLTAERDALKRRIDMERSTLARTLGEQREDARSFLYDEWDCHSQRYLHGWCRLFEERLHTDANALGGRDPDELLAAVRPLAHAVRRRFEQIRPSGYRRQAKVSDGDELDLDSIVAARSDLRVGVSPDERVYSRRERLRRDVGAVFLVDLSASTDDVLEEPSAGGSARGLPSLEEPSQEEAEAPASAPSDPQDLRDPYFDEDEEWDFEARRLEDAERRRIIDIQREAVLTMSGALEAIGDQYGIYGFSGYGRDCVEFFVAKELGQAYDRNVLEALAAMTPKRSTRMGPAIRHAVRKLEAAGTALKVLMIVSDGFPQDCDYGPERGEHEYGVQDTAKALREAEAAGIETFCVTVDRSGHDYLRRMCPEDRYMVIEESHQLPEALEKAYRQLTRL
ncbi:MAG: hypothetical protein OXI55_11585 [Gammaproteobacteria bacterium]|nr:hypothetical protein [Gammaproteobacteria bacterium]